MNKFNLPRRNIQKERRQKRAERRKHKATAAPAAHAHAHDGDDSCCNHTNSSALTLSVSSTQVHSAYLSGKRKAKLQKKWRRAQKEALQSGLVTMHDIEMMAAGGEEGDGGEAGTTTEEEAAAAASLPKSKKKFSMKKRAKLRTKSAGPVAVSGGDGGDAMVQ